MEADIDVVPEAVGAVSRQWDEQHLQLAAAAAQVGAAPTSGFSSGVTQQAAVRFVTAWQQHCAALGGECESLADGLRVTIGEYLAADGGAFMRSSSLLPWLREVR